MAVVGAAAIALGLSFGLGAKDTAAEIVRSWYQAGKAAAPKIEQATESAATTARREFGAQAALLARTMEEERGRVQLQKMP